MSSKLKFDVTTTLTSKLILNLANPSVLASNLPPHVGPSDVIKACSEISNEIDRRFPTSTLIFNARG